jgi:hypothetical protein
VRTVWLTVLVTLVVGGAEASVVDGAVVLVSVAGVVVSGVVVSGVAGCVVAGAGVVGCASCDKAGVEESARAAAIAGQAQVRA